MRCFLGSVLFLATLSLPSFDCAAHAQTPPVGGVSVMDQQVAAKNEAVVRAYYDVLAKGDWKAALEFFSDDTQNFGRKVGKVGVGFVLQDVLTTFPDFRLEITDLVTQGDMVIVRGKSSGTHLGTGRLPVNGGMLVDVPPTHKHFENEVMHWWVVRNGKIVDHYGVRDDIEMMRQLGLIPPEKPFDPSRLKLPQDAALIPTSK